MHDIDSTSDTTKVFLLYTRLASKTVPDGHERFPGLGFVDSKQDILTVRFELPANSKQTNKSSAKPSPSKARRTKKGSSGTIVVPDDREYVEYTLTQDKTALRSRQGDTGELLFSINFLENGLALNMVFPTCLF